MDNEKGQVARMSQWCFEAVKRFKGESNVEIGHWNARWVSEAASKHIRRSSKVWFMTFLSSFVVILSVCLVSLVTFSMGMQAFPLSPTRLVA